MDIYSQGMRDRSMRSGTELAREVKLTDWSVAGDLSNRSSGVQILRDICTRLKRYLYSAKCNWIIMSVILESKCCQKVSEARFTKFPRGYTCSQTNEVRNLIEV